METHDATPTGFRAPYMSFQTLWNFLADLSSKPLPPKLDRSIMSNKSGSDQTQIMAALEAFGYVDADGVVQPALVRFASADADGRKTALRALLEAFYIGPLRVSAQNGTPNDLKEVFRTEPDLQGGETQRKAITFFMHAAREAGIELSPHFPKTRTAGSGSPGTPRVKKPAKRKPADTTPQPPPATAASAGRSYTVRLNSGGTLTLSYDVDLFAVSDEDQEFLLDVVNKLRRYRSTRQDEAPTTPTSPTARSSMDDTEEPDSGPDGFDE